MSNDAVHAVPEKMFSQRWFLPAAAEDFGRTGMADLVVEDLRATVTLNERRIQGEPDIRFLKHPDDTVGQHHDAESDPPEGSVLVIATADVVRS